MRLFVEELFIMVSGVTTEQDALMSIGLGANAVAFDFGPTPQRIGSDDARDIIHRLPAGTFTVGTFRNEMPQRIVDVTNRLGLHAAQLTGRMTVEEIRYVSERVNTVIRSVGPGDSIRNGVEHLVDYFAMPEQDERDALEDCLSIFADGDVTRPIIVSGGLSATNVVEVVQNYPVFGVDARSCVESDPATKDPVLLGEFIANARWAEANAYVNRRLND